MTIRQIYEKAIAVGREADWRGEECIEEIFEQARKDSKKPGFDSDRLFNPYGDCRIAFGDPDTEVSSVLVGINITSVELILAGLLRTRGKPVDLVVCHHTSCVNRGLFHYDDILLFHKYSLAEIGVPKKTYDALVDDWCTSLEYTWKMDTLNTARLLELPLIVIHTPCDLLHLRHTREVFSRMKDRSLGEIADELNSIEETKQNPYAKVVVHGDPGALPGRVYSPICGGWRPLIGLFEVACQADIDTALLVSPTEEYFAAARKSGINVVQIPHDPIDNYGVNLMLDELERIHPLTIHEAESFTRVRRVQEDLITSSP